MRLSPALYLTVLSLAPAAATAQDTKAQDFPPREILDQIIRQLPKPLPPAKISYRPLASAGGDETCRMQNFQMELKRREGSTANTYSVLLNRQTDGTPVVPRQLLAVITRLTVDADGSERAYHPEDPYGKGVCERSKDTPGNVKLEGVCALDSFNPSGIRVYFDDKRAKLIDPDKPQKDGSPSLAEGWKEIWPSIRDRRIKAYDLKTAVPGAPDGYNFFYLRDKKILAFTNRNIIPSTRDGYPCIRGTESKHPGYFVAATTLMRAGTERADGCTPQSFLEASEIPFFVLPGGNFGQIEIGDIVIGYFKSPNAERIAFGIAGDAGPIEQFGEGSIAFNQVLRGQKAGDPVMNVKDVNAVDIGREFLKKENASLAILVLGGTKKRLNGDYSRENIERIGREELARWNGNERLTERLNACLARTKPAQ